MTDRTQLTRAVKQEAERLGFPLVGVTTPDPPDHLDDYQEWLSQGYHADMEWMATDRALARRSDPKNILPDCQSILVLGMPYPSPDGREGDGKISSYAWQENYHDVLTEKMKQLVHFIGEQIGESVPNRWYTDTGPILERELARRAGLGWFGKNTTLIHPERGSFFFLAEIFLGIELVPDSPFESEHCGTCRRCIDACPTGSLKEPHTLDANLCISYLTIELDEAIPKDLRPQMESWIFGCDICQQVCPWNQKFSENNWIIEEFRSRPETTEVDLKEEMGLSEDEFREKFRGSAVKRTKRRGYLRNVAVALGNQADKKALPVLEQALRDHEPLVREHAAWAVGQVGGNRAQAVLQDALDQEKDAQVKVEIRSALRDLSESDGKPESGQDPGA